MLFFPVSIVLAHARHANTLVFSVSVAAAVVYIFYPQYPVRILMYFAIWWTGAYVGALVLENQHRNLKPLLIPCGVLATIAGLLAVNVYLHVSSTEEQLLYGIHPFNELRHFIFSPLAIICGWVWLRSGWCFYNFTLHHFRFFAPISYVMYIVHDPLMRGATYLAFIENDVLRWFGYFFVMILVSYLIEILFYPSMRRRLQPKVEALFSR